MMFLFMLTLRVWSYTYSWSLCSLRSFVYACTVTDLKTFIYTSQALSIFRDFQLAWPPEILRIFNFMSIFNIQVDLVSPECAVKKWNYINKIWIAYLIPVIYLVFFVTFYSLKRFRRQQAIKQAQRYVFRKTLFTITYFSISTLSPFLILIAYFFFAIF